MQAPQDGPPQAGALTGAAELRAWVGKAVVPHSAQVQITGLQVQERDCSPHIPLGWLGAQPITSSLLRCLVDRSFPPPPVAALCRGMTACRASCSHQLLRASQELVQAATRVTPHNQRQATGPKAQAQICH